MQQQQQQGGNPQFGSSPFAAATINSTINSDLGLAEEASPLSSRPPANTHFDDSEDYPGASGANRWPRQETLALLQIRSDMDSIFRDANIKGPLWDDVSRKLSEQGFKRSGKKCKEKFENVHKYYKRTKEGRAGRQDGKTYRFFSQLEALHNSIPNPQITMSNTNTNTPLVGSTQMQSQFGVFKSDSEMDSTGSDEMDEDELDLDAELMEAEPSNRKRKRGSSSGKMMEFFEGLMKQVMLKQEALQQKFLEAVEKREQDRMIREEAWKRQELSRLAKEHELMVQERNISATRDAAIISFLQKITGQTIQLPVVSPPPPPPPPPPSVLQKLPTQQPPPPPPHQPPQQQQQQIVVAVPEQQVAPVEMSGGGGTGMADTAASSRWPKPEVLALIKLRSGLEPRYQEAGPKGPLWEEISAGMHSMGYKRNPKRCKEKWENINKYFKKVKESNKKRPEDAKTCPYFHELDALYRKKILGGNIPHIIGGAGGSSSQLLLPQSQQQQDSAADQIQQNMPSVQNTQPESNIPVSNGDLTATLFGEATDSGVGVAKKPEDILKEQQHQNRQNLTNDFGRIIEHHDEQDQDQDDEYDDDDDDNDDDDDDDDGDEETQEEMKMAYKIQFQRPNTTGSSSNGSGSGNGTTSFLAMVQ